MRGLVVFVCVLAMAAACGNDVTAPTSTSPATTVTTTTTTEDTATSEASPAPSDSTERPPAGNQLLLSDGLGAVRFGTPSDDALPQLIELVGSEPTDDSTTTGEMPQGFGGRTISTVRFVSFGPLTAIFSDADYYRDDGAMHFAGWILSGPGPANWATPQGITIGSTVDELQTAFGDQLRLPSTLEECTGTWMFGVGPTELGFEGEISGPPTDGSSSVTRLAAGAQSSC